MAMEFYQQSKVIDDREKRLASLKKEVDAARKSAIFGKGGEFRKKSAELKKLEAGGKTVTPFEGSKAERLSKAGKSVSMASKTAGAVSGAKDLMEMEGTGNTGSDVMSGAMSGASTGMAFGPKGAIIGGLVGAGMGILKSKSARKAAARKAFNEFQDTRAKIAGDKADREREAFSFLGQAFSQSLL
jgi:hypothetical protein